MPYSTGPTSVQTSLYASTVAEEKQKQPKLFSVQPPYDQRSLSEIVRESKSEPSIRGDRMRNQQRQRKQWRNRETYDDEDKLEFFGRPGAGAPLQGDNKKKKFTEYDTSPQSYADADQDYEKGFVEGFGKPGAGAPVRTGSGKPVTQLKGDESIRFGQKENRQRYKQDENMIRSYADVLNQQISERQRNQQKFKEEELQKERDMLKTEFYGKPGGGAPLRTHSGKPAASRTMKGPGSLEKTDGNVQVTQFNWGHGTGNPTRQENGHLMNRKGFISNSIRYVDKNIQYSNTSPISAFNDGYESPRVKRNYINDDPPSNFLLKDRGGAGAPMIDLHTGKAITKRSKNVTNISSDVNSADIQRRRRAADEYRQEQKSQIAEKRQEKDMFNKFEKDFVGMDYGTLMKSHITGYPKRNPVTGMILGNGLKSSDITQSSVQLKHYTSNENSKQYHNELSKEAEDRMMRKQLEKMKAQQEDLQHANAFGMMWGKPGAGAPCHPQNKKVNLEMALHSPRVEDGRSDYNKAQDDVQRGIPFSNEFGHKPRYVKTTIKSSSRNNFEMSPDDRSTVHLKSRVFNATSEE